jgi:hypothetical protein
MTGDDFSKYEALKHAGFSADEVYRAAVRHGVDAITMYRLIRSVFSLGFAEAKEIIIRGQGWANSLGEYQDKIADWLELEAKRELEQPPGQK